MAQHKIDNQIREKLNAREIQPSAPAWDRLDAMLTVAEVKQPKRNYTWLYIAAAFLLFSGLGFFLLNSNETVAIENVTPVVTNEVTNEKIEGNQLPTEIKFNSSEETVLVENNKLKNEGVKINDENQVDLKNQVIVVNPSPITHHPSPNNYKYLSPEELLAQIEQPSKVDTNKIKINTINKIKVDANELLTKAEQEIHQKHKESTIDKLRRNFNEVKSAVANRNYE
jgi:DnaJ-class molecular chaperone